MRTVIAFIRIPDDLDESVTARLSLVHGGGRTFAVVVEEQALRVADEQGPQVSLPG